MGKTFKDRLENLDLIEKSLKDTRKFWMREKRWDQVEICSDALKKHKEQVARVYHLSAKADSFKSA